MLAFLLPELLPAPMKRAPLSPRARRLWSLLERLLPATRLSVVNCEDMRLLVEKSPARQSDFRLQLPLADATVATDLYPHYIAFVIGGLKSYTAQEIIARTFVKYGDCLQDFCKLQISISRIRDGDETEGIR